MAHQSRWRMRAQMPQEVLAMTTTSSRVPHKRSSQQYVALLRGINLGNKNKLPMKELSSLFSTAGCSDVETYIQS